MTLAVGGASPASPPDSNDSREWNDRAPDVESRLAALARSPAALRRALARIAGRLVATRAWERLGFARLRDYAVERVGLSARELQDLARVDAALAELPRVESALVSGQIPWTKARLLCRVATREDESLWMAAAERLTAEELAREVRAVDQRAALAGAGAGRAAGAEEEERRETVRLRCSPFVRGKWFVARQLAQRAAGEALAPWACAEAIAAEVLSAIPLDGESEACCRAERPAATAHGCNPGSVQPGPRVVPPAVPLAPPPPAQAASSRFLDALVEDLDAADAFELDRRLRRAVRLEQQIEARMGPLLLTVAAERLYRELGFRSLDAYARERLGMATSKAHALLRLERACLVSPALREAWRAGQLSWSQAHALVPLLLLEHSLPWHPAWVGRARRVCVRRLEDDVDCAIATGELDPGALPAVSGSAIATALESTSAGEVPTGLQIGARPTVSGESAAGEERAERAGREDRVRLFFNAPRDVARLFRATLATVQRHVERQTRRPSNENEALDAMLEHALEA